MSHGMHAPTAEVAESGRNQQRRKRQRNQMPMNEQALFSHHLGLQSDALFQTFVLNDFCLSMPLQHL